MFVQISTDNQINSDAEANARLEEQVRAKLKRFEPRLTHVEVHVADMNGAKGGDGDKRVSLEARAERPRAGRGPCRGATRVENAVTAGGGQGGARARPCARQEQDATEVALSGSRASPKAP